VKHKHNEKIRLALMAALMSISLGGCTAVTVAGAVVGTAVGVTAVAVKGTVAVVGAVIPDEEQDNKEQ